MGRASKELIERQLRSLVLRALSVLIVAAGSWLTPAHSWAQSTRPYQMTLLGSVDAHVPNPPAVINYNATVDIRTFYFGRELTPSSGPMIVWIAPTNDMLIYDALDWSRVVAVYVDEPYISALNAALGGEGTGSPCPSGPDPRTQILQDMTETLRAMAATVRVRAPKARFWVNFHRSEVDWMQYFGCALNHAFMDVVSVDIYGKNFNNFVRQFYDYLYAHRPAPHQQLALVPGTHISPAQSAFFAWLVLQEYFAYAHNQNQTCDLPLGPIGATGFYDGCRVWIVAGWVGGASVFHDGVDHYPIEHPNSQLIWNQWESFAAKPRNPPPPDISSFNRLWVPPVLQILLD